MGERLGQPDACKVPDLLRLLNYASAEKCVLTTSLVRFQPSQGDVKTYHITRISKESSLPTEAGLFIISLDFIRPINPEVNSELIIEDAENVMSSLPHFRLNESRLNGAHILNSYEVDEVFEPSAMVIHLRLMKEIIELKRQKDTKEFERLSKLLSELSR